MTAPVKLSGLAAARPAAAGPRRLFLALGLLFALNVVFFGYGPLVMGAYLSAGGLHRPGPLTGLTGDPVGGDFVEYWAASALARAGQPIAVYSPARHGAAQRRAIGADFPVKPWNYPPILLLLVLPLSFLPYLAAFALWLAAPLAASLAVVRHLAPHALAPWLFLGFPGVVDNFLYGQNGFLSTAVLGGGLLLLDRRPVAGGLLLGLLAYKPQLAVLVPVALAAGRRWWALAAAGLSVAGLGLLSAVVLGWETWPAFLGNLPVAAGNLDLPYYWKKKVTVSAAARLAGAGRAVAGLCQAGAILVAAAAVIYVWRRGFPLPWRGATLAVAIFLAAPYAFEYDQALLSLAFAWLGWEEFSRGRLYGLSFLALCWLGLYLSGFTLLSGAFPANLMILLALLGFIFLRTSQLPRHSEKIASPPTRLT